MACLVEELSVAQAWQPWSSSLCPRKAARAKQRSALYRWNVITCMLKWAGSHLDRVFPDLARHGGLADDGNRGIPTALV